MWDWNVVAKSVQNFLNSDPMVQKFMQEAKETAIKENGLKKSGLIIRMPSARLSSSRLFSLILF